MSHNSASARVASARVMCEIFAYLVSSGVKPRPKMNLLRFRWTKQFWQNDQYGTDLKVLKVAPPRW